MKPTHHETPPARHPGEPSRRLVLGCGVLAALSLFLPVISLGNMCLVEDSFDLTVTAERPFDTACLERAVAAHPGARKASPGGAHSIPTRTYAHDQRLVVLEASVTQGKLRVSASWWPAAHADPLFSEQLDRETTRLVQGITASCGLSSWTSTCQREGDFSPCPAP